MIMVVVEVVVVMVVIVLEMRVWLGGIEIRKPETVPKFL